MKLIIQLLIILSLFIITAYTENVYTVFQITSTCTTDYTNVSIDSCAASKCDENFKVYYDQNLKIYSLNIYSSQDTDCQQVPESKEFQCSDDPINIDSLVIRCLELKTPVAYSTFGFRNPSCGIDGVEINKCTHAIDCDSGNYENYLLYTKITNVFEGYAVSSYSTKYCNDSLGSILFKCLPNNKEIEISSGVYLVCHPSDSSSSSSINTSSSDTSFSSSSNASTSSSSNSSSSSSSNSSFSSSSLNSFSSESPNSSSSIQYSIIIILALSLSLNLLF